MDKSILKRRSRCQNHNQVLLLVQARSGSDAQDQWQCESSDCTRIGHFRQRLVCLVQSGRSTWRGSLSWQRSSAPVGRRNSSSQARMRAGSTGAQHLKKSHQHLLAHPAMKYQFEAEHYGDSPVTVICHVRCRFRSAGTMPGTNVNRVSTAEKLLPLRRRSRRLLRPIDACTEAHGFPARIACTRNSEWSKTCRSPHAGTGHLRSASQTSHDYDLPKTLTNMRKSCTLEA